MKLLNFFNGIIAFPTCNTDSLLNQHYFRFGEIIVNSMKAPDMLGFPKPFTII